MKVLVTGGTGFVGAHSVKALLDSGHTVRMLVRSPDRIGAALGPLGTQAPEHVVGDVTDADSARRALEGCDAVLHAASVYTFDARRAASMRRDNMASVRIVLGTAHELGLDPIVHVSSFAALLPAQAPLTPDSPVGEPKGAYNISKAETEQVARDMQDAGAPVVITLPGMVWGPHDPNVGESAIFARDVLRGLLPFRLGGGPNVVDVRDVAAMHAAVMEPGAVRGATSRRARTCRSRASTGCCAGSPGAGYLPCASRRPSAGVGSGGRRGPTRRAVPDADQLGRERGSAVTRWQATTASRVRSSGSRSGPPRRRSPTPSAGCTRPAISARARPVAPRPNLTRMGGRRTAARRHRGGRGRWRSRPRCCFPLEDIAPAVSLGVALPARRCCSSRSSGACGSAWRRASRAALAFNFFHIPPTGRFTIAEAENWVALAVFLVVAAVASTLSPTWRGARAREAEQRRARGRPRRRARAPAARHAGPARGAPGAAKRIADALEVDSVAVVLERGRGRRAARGDLPLGDARDAASSRVAADEHRARERVAPALEALLARRARARAAHARGRRDGGPAAQRRDQDRGAAVGLPRPALAADRDRRRRRGAGLARARGRTIAPSWRTRSSPRSRAARAPGRPAARPLAAAGRRRRAARDWISLDEVIRGGAEDAGAARDAVRLAIAPDLPLMPRRRRPSCGARSRT